MGVAYKKNVDDTRESPAVSILEKLSKTYNVNYYDPYVKNVKIKNKLFTSIKELNYRKLGKYSAVLLTTNHDRFNYKKILKYSKKIFDTRGTYQNNKDKKIAMRDDYKLKKDSSVYNAHQNLSLGSITDIIEESPNKNIVKIKALLRSRNTKKDNKPNWIN